MYGYSVHQLHLHARWLARELEWTILVYGCNIAIFRLDRPYCCGNYMTLVLTCSPRKQLWYAYLW